MTAGEAITALQGSRDVEMVFYLYVVDVAPPPRRRRLAAPAAARVAGHAAQADHDDRSDQRARRHGPGRSRAAGRVLQPARDSGRRRGEQARRRHHGRRRHRRHQGRGDRGRLPPGRRRRRRARVHARVRSRCASGCRGCIVNLATAFLAAVGRRAVRATRSTRSSALAVFMPVVAGMGGNAATQTLTVIVRGHRARRADLGELAQGAVQGGRWSASATASPAGWSAALVVWVFKRRSGARRASWRWR